MTTLDRLARLELNDAQKLADTSVILRNARRLQETIKDPTTWLMLDEIANAAEVHQRLLRQMCEVVLNTGKDNKERVRELARLIEAALKQL